MPLEPLYPALIHLPFTFEPVDGYDYPATARIYVREPDADTTAEIAGVSYEPAAGSGYAQHRATAAGVYRFRLEGLTGAGDVITVDEADVDVLSGMVTPAE